MPPTLLREEFKRAPFVLLGRVENANKDAGTTALVVTDILKMHPILADFPKRIVLPRYVDDPAQSPLLLMFGDVWKGKLDIYRGVRAGPTLREYVLKGTILAAFGHPAQMLRYYFDYLEDADPEIAADAHREFAQANPDDVATAARKCAPDRLRDWLKNNKTPEQRLGLYAFLLGHCGTEQDSELVRGASEKRASDQAFIGFVLLNPKKNWDSLRDILKNPRLDFSERYAALRAARYFYNTRTDAVTKPQVIAAIEPLLDQADIADLPIEDLRRWRDWSLTEHILKLPGRASHDVPIIRRSILRYALPCPDEAAKKFVAECRKADPKWVAEVEELLRLEQRPDK